MRLLSLVQATALARLTGACLRVCDVWYGAQPATSVGCYVDKDDEAGRDLPVCATKVSPSTLKHDSQSKPTPYTCCVVFGWVQP